MTQPRSDTLEHAYPSALRTAEAEQIRLRRTKTGIDPDAPVVGAGLSGGGIRSATFCIGFFQALARKGLIRHIDFLSTVSGGGYFGSFLGAAYTRDGVTPEQMERDLADNESWPVRWLRDNGRFLAPNGAGDTIGAAAIIIRNWVALHCVLLTFAFFVFGLGVLLRTELAGLLSSSGAWMDLEHTLWEHKVLGLWWSPWVLLPLIPFATMMLPAGVLYWLTQSTPLMRGLKKMAGRFNKALRAYSDREFINHAQNRLTRLLALSLTPIMVLAAYAIIDTLGQTAYWKWAAGDFEFPVLWASLTGLGAALYGFGSKIFVFATDLLGKTRFKLPLDAMALLAASAWAGLIILGVSVAACIFAWSAEPVAVAGRLVPFEGSWQLSLAVAGALGLSWLFSRSFGFVNLSSLQQVYAARLRRAYIGATNHHRQESENYSMTEPITGDDCFLEDYRPQNNGGPLHLINVTINETISTKTRIERRDRKGVAMSVGPCGLTVGRLSHSLWADPSDTPKKQAPMRLAALFENPGRLIRPIPGGNTPERGPVNVESLSLGRWTAISGAAFTTGLGSQTRLGLSLLLGLANIRLGYWWDSGGHHPSPAGTANPGFSGLAARLLHRVLPVQTCLLNEFLARFHGTAHRHWYLSDGGHFENTGCYELVRRRTPFILCVDAGADPQYRFDDLANLVRKARIDFGAEIEIIRRADDTGRAEPGSTLPTLEQIVHPSVLGFFGSPEEFRGADPETGGPVSNPRHALLARIRYSDTGEACWLLVIKPGVGGDEPVDVLQYRRTHPEFPQEPTSDQFFDEAQWESYRKLGHHIATVLFTSPDDGDPRWSPSRFTAPELMLASSQPGQDEAQAHAPVQENDALPAHASRWVH